MSGPIFLHIRDNRTLWVPVHVAGPGDAGAEVKMLENVTNVELKHSLFLFDAPVTVVADPNVAASIPNGKAFADVKIALEQFRRLCQSDQMFLASKRYSAANQFSTSATPAPAAAPPGAAPPVPAPAGQPPQFGAIPMLGGGGTIGGTVGGVTSAAVPAGANSVTTFVQPPRFAPPAPVQIPQQHQQFVPQVPPVYGVPPPQYGGGHHHHHHHNTMMAGGRFDGPKRMDAEPFPEDVQALVDALTEEEKNEFAIDNRDIGDVFVSTMPNCRATVWLRKHTNNPANRQRYARCSKGGTVLFRNTVMEEIRSSSAMEILPKQLCLNFFSNGFCSRLGCMHTHWSEDQVRLAIAAANKKYNAADPEEREQFWEQLAAKEQDLNSRPGVVAGSLPAEVPAGARIGISTFKPRRPDLKNIGIATDSDSDNDTLSSSSSDSDDDSSDDDSSDDSDSSSSSDDDDGDKASTTSTTASKKASRAKKSGESKSEEKVVIPFEKLVEDLDVSERRARKDIGYDQRDWFDKFEHKFRKYKKEAQKQEAKRIEKEKKREKKEREEKEKQLRKKAKEAEGESDRKHRHTRDGDDRKRGRSASRDRHHRHRRDRSKERRRSRSGDRGGHRRNSRDRGSRRVSSSFGGDDIGRRRRDDSRDRRDKRDSHRRRDDYRDDRKSGGRRH